MALPTAARAVSSTLPPGLLRLGLAPGRLHDVSTAAQAGPLEALVLLTKHKELSVDEGQRKAAMKLNEVWQSAQRFTQDFLHWQELHRKWQAECARLQAEYQEMEAQRKKTEEKSEAKEPAPVLQLPPEPSRPSLEKKGCYLWGQVGRGKTLLMDLLALSLRRESDVDVEVAKLQRVHFHEFTHSLHRRLHQRRSAGARDGMATVINQVVRGCPPVLCFDEFQITTIADATLLTPLFSELLARDALLVATSNRPPEELYLDGLGREAHLPAFENLLRSNLEVHELDGPTDYREARFVASQRRLVSEDFQVGGPLDLAFQTACGGVPAQTRHVAIAWGRVLPVQLAGGVARFGFEELCGTPLSSEDYLALIQGGVHTFVVSEIPQFNLNLHNEARRFTNFVDALYEHQCRLICSAETSIDKLLQGMDRLCGELETDQPAMGIGGSEQSLRWQKHGDVSFQVGDNSPCRPDTFATAEADAEAGTSCVRLGDAPEDSIAGVMSAAVDSLRETGFAARRCTSRLREMNSETYLQGHKIRWGTS